MWGENKMKMKIREEVMKEIRDTLGRIENKIDNIGTLKLPIELPKTPQDTFETPKELPSDKQEMAQYRKDMEPILKEVQTHQGLSFIKLADRLRITKTRTRDACIALAKEGKVKIENDPDNKNAIRVYTIDYEITIPNIDTDRLLLEMVTEDQTGTKRTNLITKLRLMGATKKGAERTIERALESTAKSPRRLINNYPRKGHMILSPHGIELLRKIREEK